MRCFGWRPLFSGLVMSAFTGVAASPQQTAGPETRMVDVDGHAMRVQIAGLESRRRGSPVVVFEAGATNAVEAWGDQSMPLAEMKIRGLQSQGQACEAVQAGMRVAVNLSGRGTLPVRRGMVLSAAAALRTSTSCVAWLQVLGSASASSPRS